jgi:putative ABC transport system permease protein
MFKNNLKLAIRNFLSHKGITFIQIIGLSAGLAVCLLIILVVRYEYSFDKFHSKGDKVYRIVLNYNKNGEESYSATTPYPLPDAMRNDFPELKKIAGIHIQHDAVIKTKDRKLFKEPSILFAQPELADILDIKMVTGNVKTSLGQLNQAIINKTAAKKYFGDENPVGQTITLDNKLDVQVAGVMNDWPQTSHLTPSILVSYISFTEKYFGFDPKQWGVHSAGRTYFLAPDNFNIPALKAKLQAFIKDHIPEDDRTGFTFDVQPLKTFHTDQRYLSDEEKSSAISPVYLNIFLLIGGLILLVAVINYINLSTARGALRNKEIGVRKLIGASRKQVTWQLLVETVLLTFIAGVAAMGILSLILPWFNKLFQKSIAFSFPPLFIITYFFFLLVISLIAGIYPAFVLSGAKPLVLARSRALTGSSNKQWVRQSLVAIQFACAVALVFGTLVIALQIRYIHKKDQGFQTKNMLTIQLPEAKNFDLLRREWAKIAGVQNVTFNLAAPASETNFGTGLFPVKGSKDRIDIQFKPVDAEYQRTFGLHLIAGRWLNAEDEKYADLKLPEKDQRYSFVVNEKLVHALGLRNVQDAIGKKYVIGVNDIEGEIVGVVRDFHYASLHEPIKPLVFSNFSYFYYSAGIQLSNDHPQAALKAIEKVYTSQFPDTIFQYAFLDDTINGFYESDQRAFNILMLFAALALLLACLGLVGLSIFVIQRRFKEIGIRKVLGSTVSGIVTLLSWEFLRPVFVACLIAFPVSWWAMNKWLNDFAYRINISWWMLLLAGVTAVIIAMVTVGFQSIKAALSNPVKNLRTE